MHRLLALALLSAAASAQVTYYSAYLSPDQEVPATASTGHGWGIVRFDAATSTVQLFCHHVGLTSGAVAAHIHQGATGINGPVIVGMTSTGPNTWTGSGPMTAAQAAALATSGMYLNVHTSTFPGGEIRGQVELGKCTRFTGVLTGAQEVPATGSAGTGTAVAFLYQPDNRLVYAVDSTGLANVIAAHFHQAPAGVNGPVVVGFSGSGTYCGITPRLDATQLAALMANGWYANIHTGTFPGGEIRAQMLRDVGDHFYAVCNGASETPPVPSGAVGGASLVLAPNGTVSVNGQFAGITSGAVAAHVHVGAPGVAGPVVFGLSFAGGVLSGTYTPTAADLVNLRAGNWYVNVHSSSFPGGEIRGQLAAAELPSSFGEGCPSTSGALPRAGATGVPTIGAPVRFDVYGAPAGRPSILFVCSQRDPGPLDLLPAGAPDCFALLNGSFIELQVFTAADALGCAHAPLVAPLNPILRGLSFGTQWAISDPAANPFQIVVSNALWFTLP